MHDAYAQSHITYTHLCAKVCCVLYCLWVRYILNDLNIEDAWNKAFAQLRNYFQNKPQDLEQLEFYIPPDELEKSNGSGYVVGCLKSV